MPASPERPYLVPALVLGVISVTVAIGVAGTLDRPEVPTYAPSVARPAEVGEALVGPVEYTLQATEQGVWRFFDFSRGAEVARPGALDWDLAVSRYNVIVNGGEGFAGSGGALALEGVAFDDVASALADGYQPTTVRSDSVHHVLQSWYDYGFTSHLLTPEPDRVFLLRTADGRYAKMQILSYYCPGALPGCLTFRYVYQGDGTPSFVGAGTTPVERPDSEGADPQADHGRANAASPDAGGRDPANVTSAPAASAWALPVPEASRNAGGALAGSRVRA